jgi:hypothetical protein
LFAGNAQFQYRQRTKWNVRDADATLIMTLRAQLTGGTRLTRQYAERLGRPCLHVVPGNEWTDKVKGFLETHAIRILNVAGPRASSAPGIEQFVQEVPVTGDSYDAVKSCHAKGGRENLPAPVLNAVFCRL